MGKKYPFYIKINMNKDKWFPQFRLLSKNYTHAALLESGRGGKYSIMGFEPVAIMNGKNNKLHITMNENTTTIEGNPLHEMGKWMEQFQIEQNPELPDFQSGAIGFISYDYARYIEKLPSISEDDLNTPDLYFMIFDEVFIYEHENEALYIVTCMDEDLGKVAHHRLNQLKDQWLQADDPNHSEHAQKSIQNDLHVSLTDEEFKNAVNKVQEYISQGDIFQVNLSVRQSQKLHVEPIDVYSSLRDINPSPYMAYIHTPDFQIVSGSPELLVKKSGKVLSTRPIAGTRSRGINEEEDEKLAKELIENEKERAEHVMLVDLERNDLGKVCKYGTVEVDEFMVIERYSHVMHIVSNVKGELADQYDAYDVIDAVFPGGTITGAPKVRTMEIIEELEPVRRGIYTGSIGWIGYNGDMELNITIRTMMVSNDQAYIQAGAGVVIDSNPSYEYKESLKKAKALWRAKEVAEENVKVTIS
ncbi:aminodeoxychorismate synthase, component I [Bacillus suaedaesalsae]|uniref:aminodeoxychorismate synthase n=1 Tax=Bacillus suaedaesalsae TaxID=2810349 RepID=A0ABS2DC92_9BACI|nr:aminodeoxychorismate synthase, component I [Bacillus suaedaesalsae]MBM6616082.1 aminodeoxychorismate synthase, component I [Bacillus suaedaesalsae]